MCRNAELNVPLSVIMLVSGEGVQFMRPWTERVYGILPDKIVGRSGKLQFEMRDGNPVLLKLRTQA